MISTGDQGRAGGDRPPKRLLERPPSERLAATGANVGGANADGANAAEAAAAAGSPVRALAYGSAAAAAGAAVHVLAATLLLWTAALLVVAATIGVVVGLAVAVGGGRSLRVRDRRLLGPGLAVAAIVVATGVNWALSGMYLGPFEYVAQVYGLLVPLQLAFAAGGALAGTR
jgi:hypothetical protein